MAGRKTFTAGEVLQAADVNDFLMDQSVMVFAGTAARGSAIPSPSEGMVTYLEDADELQVYTTAWGAVAGGKILQVVSTTKSDAFTTTSTSFTDITGLSASITPSSASSKIMVFVSMDAASTVGYAGAARLLRGATPISVGDAAGSRTPASMSFNNVGGSANNRLAPFALNFLDSPSTTSSTTYKMEGFVQSGGTLYVNRGESATDSALVVRLPSTITLMEVAG